MLTLLAAIAASDIAKQYSRDGVSIGVGACLLGVIFVAQVRWDLKAEWWFWLALIMGAVLQIPIIFLMPWAAHTLTGTGAMAYVIPGFLMALGCVFFAEKLFANNRPK